MVNRVSEGKRGANEELNRSLVGVLFAVVEYGYVSVLERTKLIHNSTERQKRPFPTIQVSLYLVSLPVTL